MGMGLREMGRWARKWAPLAAITAFGAGCSHETKEAPVQGDIVGKRETVAACINGFRTEMIEGIAGVPQMQKIKCEAEQARAAHQAGDTPVITAQKDRNGVFLPPDTTLEGFPGNTANTWRQTGAGQDPSIAPNASAKPDAKRFPSGTEFEGGRFSMTGDPDDLLGSLPELGGAAGDSDSKESCAANIGFESHNLGTDVSGGAAFQLNDALSFGIRGYERINRGDNAGGIWGTALTGAYEYDQFWSIKGTYGWGEGNTDVLLPDESQYRRVNTEQTTKGIRFSLLNGLFQKLEIGKVSEFWARYAHNKSRGDDIERTETEANDSSIRTIWERFGVYGRDETTIAGGLGVGTLSLELAHNDYQFGHQIHEDDWSGTFNYHENGRALRFTIGETRYGLGLQTPTNWSSVGHPTLSFDADHDPHTGDSLNLGALWEGKNGSCGFNVGYSDLRGSSVGLECHFGEGNNNSSSPYLTNFSGNWGNADIPAASPVAGSGEQELRDSADGPHVAEFEERRESPNDVEISTPSIGRVGERIPLEYRSEEAQTGKWEIVSGSGMLEGNILIPTAAGEIKLKLTTTRDGLPTIQEVSISVESANIQSGNLDTGNAIGIVGTNGASITVSANVDNAFLILERNTYPEGTFHVDGMIVSFIPNENLDGTTPTPTIFINSTGHGNQTFLVGTVSFPSATIDTTPPKVERTEYTLPDSIGNTPKTLNVFQILGIEEGSLVQVSSIAEGRVTAQIDNNGDLIISPKTGEEGSDIIHLEIFDRVGNPSVSAHISVNGIDTIGPSYTKTVETRNNVGQGGTFDPFEIFGLSTDVENIDITSSPTGKVDAYFDKNDKKIHVTTIANQSGTVFLYLSPKDNLRNPTEELLKFILNGLSNPQSTGGNGNGTCIGPTCEPGTAPPCEGEACDGGDTPGTPDPGGEPTELPPGGPGTVPGGGDSTGEPQPAAANLSSRIYSYPQSPYDPFWGDLRLPS